MVGVDIISHFQCCDPLTVSHVIHFETKGNVVSTSFLVAGLNAVVCSRCVVVRDGDGGKVTLHC